MATVEGRDFTPDQMADMFLAYGDNMLRAMMAGGKAAVLMMAGHAVERELSFPKSGPPVFPGLRWQTGHLRRSVAASPEAHAISDREGEASFGTNVDYGVAFETGGDFVEHVPRHERTLKVGHRKAVAFNIHSGYASKYSKGRRLTDEDRRSMRQGGSHWVRAHERFVHREARRYLGRTLESDAQRADQLIDGALRMLLKTGEVPTAGKVLGGAK